MRAIGNLPPVQTSPVPAPTDIVPQHERYDQMKTLLPPPLFRALPHPGIMTSIEPLHPYFGSTIESTLR